MIQIIIMIIHFIFFNSNIINYDIIFLKLKCEFMMTQLFFLIVIKLIMVAVFVFFTFVLVFIFHL